MQTKLLYLFTRTPLHVGAGASVGAIDQPVQRERHTGFPIIPGSSIKGVLADQFIDYDENNKPILDESRNATQRTEDGARLFGLGASKEESDNGRAGSLSIGEASLLAFPVRSAKGCFAWLTSPLILERWKRATDQTLSIPDITDPGHAYFNLEILGENECAVFEDYLVQHQGEFEAATSLARTIQLDNLWDSLASKYLALVSDELLAHFALTACQVAQHVVIDDETGTAKEGLLFNQENVPAETLFYASIVAKEESSFSPLNIPNPLQLGGNATTGLGFCSAKLVSHS